MAYTDGIQNGIIKMVSNRRRFPIKLPAWHEKYLILWAAMKATSKTGLSQNILQARIEANQTQIEEMLTDYAKDKKLTVEELKTQILSDNDFTAIEEDEK